MDPTAITAATSGHDSSPFAFSANGTGADRVQPGFFCRTVLSTITSPNAGTNAGTTGAATADTVLTGGSKS